MKGDTEQPKGVPPLIHGLGSKKTKKGRSQVHSDCLRLLNSVSHQVLSQQAFLSVILWLNEAQVGRGLPIL